jgi:hypothetical protein
MTRVLNLKAISLSNFTLIYQSSPKHTDFVKFCMQACTNTNLQNVAYFDDKELKVSVVGDHPPMWWCS